MEQSTKTYLEINVLQKNWWVLCTFQVAEIMKKLLTLKFKIGSSS